MDAGEAERLASMDRDVEILSHDQLEGIQVPGGREAGLRPGNVETDHAGIAMPHGQLGDLPAAGRGPHCGNQCPDLDGVASLCGQAHSGVETANYGVDHLIEGQALLGVEFGRETYFGVHDTIGSEILRSLCGSAGEAVSGLGNAHRVCERLEVELQVAAVRAACEPLSQFIGISGREFGVALLGSQLDNGLGSHTAVQVVMKQHLGSGKDLVSEGNRHLVTVSARPGSDLYPARVVSSTVEPVTEGAGPAINLSGVKVVAFDGDDTLWHSETFFVLTQQRFDALLSPWCEPSETAERLLRRERDNLAFFGYGVKGFALSMIETAIDASDGAIPSAALGEIVEWARDMMAHPVELLPGVEETLDGLADRYRLLIITKGDLFHQESKVAASGLADRFEAVHIVSEKDPATYAQIVSGLGLDSPEEFLMVGNSTRSDIEPVLAVGGRAIHVPADLTWAVEHADQTPEVPVLGNLTDLLDLL